MPDQAETIDFSLSKPGFTQDFDHSRCGGQYTAPPTSRDTGEHSGYRRSWLGINRLNPHLTHDPRYPLMNDRLPLLSQPGGHSAHTVKGRRWSLGTWIF